MQYKIEDQKQVGEKEQGNEMKTERDVAGRKQRSLKDELKFHVGDD